MFATPMTAVVTGSTRGIGLAIAHCFAEAGHQVVSNGRGNINPQLSGYSQVVHVSGDVGDPSTSARLHAAAHERFGSAIGRLVVVANAGIDAADTETEKVKAMVHTNEEGPRHLLNAFAEDLRRPDSLFVAVGSIVGTLGIVLPGNIEYQRIKAAVEAMVRGMVATHPGIEGITLSPGFIRTGMTDKSMVYGILFRFAAIAASHNPEIHQLMSQAVGEDLGQTGGDIFVKALGHELLQENDPRTFGSMAKVLGKDPAMAGNMAALLSAKLAFNKDSEHHNDAIRARMGAILAGMDVLIGPEDVASTLSNEVLHRSIPNGGVLPAFQSGHRPVSPIEIIFKSQG